MRHTWRIARIAWHAVHGILRYADTHSKTCIYIYIFDAIYMYLHFHVSTLTCLDACIYIYMYLHFCIDMRGCNPHVSTSTRIYIYTHLHLHVKGSDAHSMSVNVHCCIAKPLRCKAFAAIAVMWRRRLDCRPKSRPHPYRPYRPDAKGSGLTEFCSFMHVTPRYMIRIAFLATCFLALHSLV